MLYYVKLLCCFCWVDIIKNKTISFLSKNISMGSCTHQQHGQLQIILIPNQ